MSKNLEYEIEYESTRASRNFGQTDSKRNKVVIPAHKLLLSIFLCTDYLERNLDFSNLFCVLHHAQCYENKDLLHSYWDLIDKETEKALKSSEVITVDISVVEELVKRVRDIECQRSRVV